MGAFGSWLSRRTSKILRLRRNYKCNYNRFVKQKADLNANSTERRSRTDWKRVDATKDSDIDYSDIPRLSPDFFANAILWPGRKKQITLRLDPDVIAFFRKTGKGYQTTINAVLRKYVEGSKNRVG